MIFRLGVKEFIRNIYLNILTILQLTVTFILVILLVSSVASRLRLYKPFSQDFQSKGAIIHTNSSPDPDSFFWRKEEIINKYPFIKDITGLYVASIDTNNYPLNIWAYDDKIVENFTPILEEGSWIGTSLDSGELKAVISQNNYGIKVGDVIQGKTFNNTEEIDIAIEIIGVLREGANIVGSGGIDINNDDYRSFYTSYNFSQEEVPLLLMSIDSLERNNINSSLANKALVTFYSDAGSEELAELSRDFMLIDMEEINERSITYISKQLYILLPIIICILILVIVSSFSISLINAKRQLKNYGIYYMCGSRWLQCGLINLVSSFMTLLFSILLSFTVLLGFYVIGSFDEIVIEFGLYQFLACLIVALIQLAFSSIAPFISINKTTAKEVISNNG